MGYGYKYGYGVRRGGALAPCLTYAVSQPYLFNSDATLFLDKDTVRAADCLIKSACIELTGVCFTTFANDVLLYVDKVEIVNSADNVTWSTSIDDETLYTIDTAARTFQLDKVEHYYSRVRLYYNNGSEFEDISDWLLSSNGVDEVNRADESEWIGKQFPFNELRDGVILSNDLIW